MARETFSTICMRSQVYCALNSNDLPINLMFVLYSSKKKFPSAAERAQVQQTRSSIEKKNVFVLRGEGRQIMTINFRR